MEDIDLKKIDLSERKITRIVFFSSLMFYMVLGLFLSYNYDFSNNNNLLFEADSKRVITDMTTIFASHYRIKVHPLFILLVQPVYFLVKGIVLDKMLACIVISSVVTSLSASFLYLIMTSFSQDKKLPLCLTACYVFSFSNIVFTAGIEVFNIAAFFLLLLWYYVIKKRDEEQLSYKSIVILMILGVLSYSVTITNLIIFWIVLFYLFISKKASLNTTLFMCIAVIVFSGFLGKAQKYVWPNIPEMDFREEENYINYTVDKEELKTVLQEDYYHSIIGADVKAVSIDGKEYNGSNYKIVFSDMGIICSVFMTLFYLLMGFFIVRNFKKNKYLNIVLILALLFNSLLHIFYGNSYCFLYSLHFLYLIFIVMGMNVLAEENEKIKKYAFLFLFCFGLVQYVYNHIAFWKVIHLACEYLPSYNHLVTHFGLPDIFLCSIILVMFVILLMNLLLDVFHKFQKENDSEKKILYLVLELVMFFSISFVFIWIEKMNCSYPYFANVMTQSTVEDSAVHMSDFSEESGEKNPSK